MKGQDFLLKLYSLLLILVGSMVISLPLHFWDFLITYQFKPTVRPYYPLYYGTLLVVGIILVIYGILGFTKKYSIQTESGKKNCLKYVPPLLSLVLAVALPIIVGNVYITTSYLIADKLYVLILLGIIIAIVMAFVLLISSTSTLYAYIKKKNPIKFINLINTIPLILVLAGIVVVGALFGPPDAECQPYPEDLPYKTVLYAQGDSGYDTFKIPTMITAPNGTILSFIEARVDSQEDWSKTDMVMRKSYDGGYTWTPLEVVYEEGDLTIGNTCPVVDESNGVIWVIFCKNNERCFKMNSTDNGETWSTPVDITDVVKRDGWTWYATGPTHGIQLDDGTLVIPADHVENRKMYAHVIYSEDHGATWKLGGSIQGGEEATLVQLDNGSLYMNVRPVYPSYRVYTISNDKGNSWSEFKFDKSLPDPACQGNLIEMNNPDSLGETIYIFSNSADSLHREKMTVRVSYDQCQTWEDSKVLYSGMTSYSDMSLIDPLNNIIGISFERGCNYYAEEIVFARFPLNYITS